MIANSGIGVSFRLMGSNGILSQAAATAGMTRQIDSPDPSRRFRRRRLPYLQGPVNFSLMRSGNRTTRYGRNERPGVVLNLPGRFMTATKGLKGTKPPDGRPELDNIV